jgi:uncharacterized phage protein (TIGR01671 family)
MKELKFRAWVGSENTDRVDEEMHFEYGLCLLQGKYADADAFGEIYGTYEDVPVEQYTGLKDGNGKEIYEGDIVEEKINTGDYDVDGTYRYKVVWDDDMLCWSLNPNSTSIHKDLWECNHSLKVIGNIHENPELIGGGE